MGGHRSVPPSRGKQQFVVGAWAVATPPGWGGRGESPSGAWPPAGTLSQAACPCRAHPCPSLPASPTLSPALSTRHTSPGGLAPFPSFMGSKGQAEGWQRGAASLPFILPGMLPLGCVPRWGLQASWMCDGQGCSIPAPWPHAACTTTTCTSTAPWPHGVCAPCITLTRSITAHELQ